MLPYYVIIPAISALTCFIAGIIFWNGLLPSLKLFVAEAILSCSIDISCYLHFHHYNGIIHNLFCFADFFLILFGTYSLQEKKISYRLYAVLSGIFISCWSFFVLSQDNINMFANEAVIVSSLLLSINYMVTLYQFEMRFSRVGITFIRLLCFSVIIYMSGTFALFVAINRFLMHRDIPEWLGDINTCMDSIRYILLAIVFYLCKKEAGLGKTVING